MANPSVLEHVTSVAAARREELDRHRESHAAAPSTVETRQTLLNTRPSVPPTLTTLDSGLCDSCLDSLGLPDSCILILPSPRLRAPAWKDRCFQPQGFRRFRVALARGVPCRLYVAALLASCGAGGRSGVSDLHAWQPSARPRSPTALHRQMRHSVTPARPQTRWRRPFTSRCIGCAPARVCSFCCRDDRRHLTVARAVGYPLDDRESWEIDQWGEDSPFNESLRRLTPVVIKSAASRPAEYEAWSSAGPWSDHEACLVLPIAVDRQVIGFLQIDFDDASRILDRRPRVHPHVVLPHRADAAAHVVVRVGRAGSRRCGEPERAGGCRAGGTPEDRGRASCERDAVSRARDADDPTSRADRGTVGGRQRRRRHARHRRAGADRRRRQRRRSQAARQR